MRLLILNPYVAQDDPNWASGNCVRKSLDMLPIKEVALPLRANKLNLNLRRASWSPGRWGRVEEVLDTQVLGVWGLPLTFKDR